jgi:hypothetical protein
VLPAPAGSKKEHTCPGRGWGVGFDLKGRWLVVSLCRVGLLGCLVGGVSRMLGRGRRSVGLMVA